jgi:hypothetical protein
LPLCRADAPFAAAAIKCRFPSGVAVVAVFRGGRARPCPAVTVVSLPLPLIFHFSFLILNSFTNRRLPFSFFH